MKVAKLQAPGQSVKCGNHQGSLFTRPSFIPVAVKQPRGGEGNLKEKELF